MKLNMSMIYKAFSRIWKYPDNFFYFKFFYLILFLKVLIITPDFSDYSITVLMNELICIYKFS